MQRRTVLLLPSNDSGWSELTQALLEMAYVDLRLAARPVVGPETIRLAAALQPDLVISAVHIDNVSTFPLLTELQRHTSTETRIIAVADRIHPDELPNNGSMRMAAHLHWRDLRSPALSYMLETILLSDVIVVSQQIAQIFVATRCRQVLPSLAPPLRPRERSVLRLLAEGLTEKQIAQVEGISRRTVERLVAGLEDKLDAPTQFALAIRAADLGVLG